MKRGEIWWANLPPSMRSRPVILLSRNEAYERRLSVTIAPITTRIRDIPTEVSVGLDEGLPKRSVISVDDITTIPLAWLERRIGHLSPLRTEEVNEAIRFALDLPSS